jgi:hypothetical protein
MFGLTQIQELEVLEPLWEVGYNILAFVTKNYCICRRKEKNAHFDWLIRTKLLTGCIRSVKIHSNALIRGERMTIQT